MIEKDFTKFVEQKIENGDWFFCFLNDMSLDQQGEIALEISNLSKTDDSVLDVTPDEVLEKACVALLFDEETDKVIAMATMMAPRKNRLGMNVGEIGTMFTLDGYNRKGAATFLVGKIDEWAKQQGNIDGAYAFLNDKSPKSFAVNGYAGEVFIEGCNVNSADFVPDYAIDLCRTVCRDPHALQMMFLDSILEKFKTDFSEIELDVSVRNVRRSIQGVLDYNRESRRRRFDYKIHKNFEKIINARNQGGKDEEIEIYKKINEFYRKNLENNLRCCDVAVAKLYK